MLEVKSYQGDSLQEAREFVKEKAYTAKGTTCPCCGKRVKSYRRPFNHQMARFMILLVWTFERTGKWIHVSSEPWFNFKGGDYAKVKYWGLAEHKPNTDDPDKKESGMWRPTELGIKFAHKLESVPRYAHVNWMKKVERFSGLPIFVDKALQNKFNYTELMAQVMNY